MQLKWYFLVIQETFYYTKRHWRKKKNWNSIQRPSVTYFEYWGQTTNLILVSSVIAVLIVIVDLQSAASDDYFKLLLMKDFGWTIYRNHQLYE